jgi:hypothetical protein
LGFADELELLENLVQGVIHRDSCIKLSIADLCLGLPLQTTTIG